MTPPNARASANTTTRPTPIPIDAVLIVSLSIPATICRTVAPIAMRMPNSRVRWARRNATTAYVPVADPFGKPNERKPGLSAVKIATGETLWQTAAPPAKCAWGTQRCTNAQSAAASLIPGVVFSGTADGHLRAYAASDGKIIWDFDTAAAPYDAVNGKQAKGGTIDAGGVTIANGMLYVNSGYGMIIGWPGNALLAFSVDGK